MIKSVYSSLQVVNNQAQLDLILWQIKDKDYCPIEIIKGLTDKGQFQ